MLDAHRAFRRDGQSGMLAPPGLDAGLPVGGDDKFIIFEGFIVLAKLARRPPMEAIAGKERDRYDSSCRWRRQLRPAEQWSYRAR